jgi:TPR repeat protein
MFLKILVPLGLLAAPVAAVAQPVLRDAAGGVEGADDAAVTAKLEQLAQSGNAEAAYHAGMAYLRGINGVEKDPAKAFEYFKKSAEGGDPLGAYQLGSFYESDRAGVVTADPDLALKHKLVAAEAGYSLAQHDVAKLYYQKDQPDDAVKWLTASARQGYKESLQALASLYSGEGKLPKNMGRSYAYLLLMQGGSLDKADGKARQVLQELSAKLTPAEKSEANKTIAGWEFKPSILTLHALAGQKSARALIDRAEGSAEVESAPLTRAEAAPEPTAETAEAEPAPETVRAHSADRHRHARGLVHTAPRPVRC